MEIRLTFWMEREHYYGKLEIYFNVYLGLGINVVNFGGSRTLNRDGYNRLTDLGVHNPVEFEECFVECVWSAHSLVTLPYHLRTIPWWPERMDGE